MAKMEGGALRYDHRRVKYIRMEKDLYRVQWRVPNLTLTRLVTGRDPNAGTQLYYPGFVKRDGYSWIWSQDGDKWSNDTYLSREEAADKLLFAARLPQ